MNYLIIILILMAVLLIWHCSRITKLEDTIAEMDDFLGDICDVINDLQEKK